MPVLACKVVQWLLGGQDARDTESWESIIIACTDYRVHMPVYGNEKAGARQPKE